MRAVRAKPSRAECGTAAGRPCCRSPKKQSMDDCKSKPLTVTLDESRLVSCVVVHQSNPQALTPPWAKTSEGFTVAHSSLLDTT
jgi:hypothetical protein